MGTTTAAPTRASGTARSTSGLQRVRSSSSHPDSRPSCPITSGPATKAAGSAWTPSSATFTTDGSDPRLPGGSPSPSATFLASGAHITANSTFEIVTRTYQGGTRGAPATEIHTLDPQASAFNLMVSEIMSHPLGGRLFVRMKTAQRSDFQKRSSQWARTCYGSWRMGIKAPSARFPSPDHRVKAGREAASGWFTGKVEHHIRGGVNMHNLIEGREAIVESPTGAFSPHIVHYAETFIIPACAGTCAIRPNGESTAQECATRRTNVRS